MAKKADNRDNVHIIELGKIRDKRGNLSVIDESKIPFKIERTYWIYDVPGGEHRGAHAYRSSLELITALSGSFDVAVHDGTHEEVFHLDRCSRGLYIPSGTWRQMRNFATNSIALVVTSTPYTPHDYIRDFQEYIMLKKEGRI